MNEKLGYLEQLKNNMGEEMAEMMSEEITKVMEEQRNIEFEYARLVQQRDQLKGITNKHRLEETKRDIMVSPRSVTLSIIQIAFLLVANRQRTEGQHEEAVQAAAEEAGRGGQPAVGAQPQEGADQDDGPGDRGDVARLDLQRLHAPHRGADRRLP